MEGIGVVDSNTSASATELQLFMTSSFFVTGLFGLQFCFLSSVCVMI